MKRGLARWMLILIVSSSVASATSLDCRHVPAELFHPAEPPELLVGKRLSLSGSGKVLGFFSKEKDGRVRVLKVQRQKAEEFFLTSPAGESFREPTWALWDGGDVATVDDEGFFAVYRGSSLVFWQAKKYRQPVAPAFRSGEIFWCPSAADLNRERKSDVVRAISLATNKENQVWSVADINWDAPLPEKMNKLKEKKAFAVPSRNGTWVVEQYGGRVYFLHAGKGEEVFSAHEHNWTHWSQGEAKEQIAQELEKMTTAKVAEAEALLLGDATRPKRKKVHVSHRLWESYFLKGFARGDELLLPLDVEKPEKAMLWLRRGEGLVCLSLAALVERSADWKAAAESWRDEVAVTDDAIWLKRPFGFILFDELAQWLAEHEEEARQRRKE